MLDPRTARLMNNVAIQAVIVDLTVAALKKISSDAISGTLDGKSITSRVVANLAVSRLRDNTDVKRGLRT